MLHDAVKRVRRAARAKNEEALRAALGDAQAAIERAFAALPERAT